MNNIEPWSHFQKSGKFENRVWRGPEPPAVSYTYSGSQTTYGEGFPEGHKTWCGGGLGDGDGMVSIAAGPHFVGGVSPNSPNCGRCLCMRLTGTDTSRNPWPPESAKPYYGKVLKGKIIDQCPECEGGHIDVYIGNYYQSQVDYGVSKTVGIWMVEWGFIDCNDTCQ